MHADLHLHMLPCIIGCTRFNGIQHAFELFAQEHGNDGGRRFVCTQAVVVARSCNGDAQEILIFIHRFDYRAEEKQELRVFMGRIARLKQVHARVGAKRPVVVLAASVYAVKRLFMQQAHKAMLFRELLHDFHRELIVVGCDVGG